MSSIKYKGQTYSGASSIEDASHVIATDASGNLTTVQALLDAGAGIVELTQAQYDALPTATKNDGRIYAITDGTTTAIAEDVRYDNTDSGLTASNVQDAVDEITTTVSENFGDVFGDFASIEASSTASKAYAVGDYLVYDSKFYKVTSAISQGDTIVPNTNVEQTTVADEFSNASNVDYSNTTSGLAATNVQGAVDELNSNFSGISFLQAIRGSTGGTKTSVTLPLNRINFSNTVPMLLYGVYRTAGDTNNDGIAIIKKYSDVAYIAKKQGFATLTDVSYSVSDNTITFTCGSYMSLVLIAANDSFL